MKNVTLNLSEHGVIIDCAISRTERTSRWENREINLLQKFTQGSLEGAEKVGQSQPLCIQAEQDHKKKPGMKRMQKSHSKTGMTNYGKIKKNSSTV